MNSQVGGKTGFGLCIELLVLNF